MKIFTVQSTGSIQLVLFSEGKKKPTPGGWNYQDSVYVYLQVARVGNLT